MNKPYQKLQAEYYKPFPEDLKLEFGCEVEVPSFSSTQDYPNLLLVIKDNFEHPDSVDVYDYEHQEFCTREKDYLLSGECKLLGKPLTLAMILRMLDIMILDVVFITGTMIIHGNPKGGRFDIALPLELDPKDYPEETLLEICNLLDI